jgi:hypothetical protein
MVKVSKETAMHVTKTALYSIVNVGVTMAPNHPNNGAQCVQEAQHDPTSMTRIVSSTSTDGMGSRAHSTETQRSTHEKLQQHSETSFSASQPALAETLY